MALTQATNAQVEDPLTAAMNAIAKGEDPAQAVYGSKVGFDELESSPEDDKPNPLDSIQETEADADAEEEVDKEPSKSASQEETDESPSLSKVKETSKIPDSNPDTEKVYAKGEDGKRREILIDYSNRDKIKQDSLKAAGYDLLSKKFSSTTRKLSGIEKEYNSLKADMDKLEDIYKNQGVKALISQLGGEKALSELVDAEIKHREYIGSLTPEEKYRLDLKQQHETASKRASEIEQKYQKKLEEIEQKEEQAVTRSLESRLHPAFDRYRFAGKLGDEVVEHQLDETVWNQVTKRLTEYPEDVELTAALIDREFRSVAQNLQKVIQVQAEKRVAKTVDKKKAEAAKTAQLTAKKGLANSGEKDKFVQSIKSGNILDAMSAMMTGKVKL